MSDKAKEFLDWFNNSQWGGAGKDAGELAWAAWQAAREPEPEPPVNDIWKDPMVMEALKDGRSADDIAVLACPECHRWGYYNQGSHFSCRFCNDTWRIRDEDDTEHTTLADTVTETTGGYHNETRNAE